MIRLGDLGLPERLEFGNPEHIRLVREAEERAAREAERARRVAEGPYAKYRVTYSVLGAGEAIVEAADEEHARELFETGQVGLDLTWEDVIIEDVVALAPGPEQAPISEAPRPPQEMFPFAASAGEEGGRSP